MARPTLKKSVYFSILFLIVWGFAEIAALAYYRIVHGEWFSWSILEQQRDEVLSEYLKEVKEESDRENRSLQKAKLPKQQRTTDTWVREEVLHPYLGYVARYVDGRCPDIGFCDSRMRDSKQDFFKREKGKVYVGIFGGSFGQGVSVNSTPGKIESALKSIPEYSDKEIVIYTLALGGYKQPQQLLTLNYFLIQGMPFDLIINIDGYNDLVLPISEGISLGTHPVFPRSWARRLKGSYNKDMLLILARTERLKKKRFESAHSLSNSVFRFSIVANAYWASHDKRVALRMAESQAEFVNYNSSKRFQSTFAARGPAYPRDLTEDTIEDLLTIWSNSSLQMHRIALANGSRYFHFLQPNQYIDGSKPMSEKERAIAITARGSNQQFALDHYNRLSEQGAQLKDMGVSFHDLTQVYSAHEEPLYRDSCCHVNQRGYDIVIDAIVERIQLSK